jgi:hypothetical protein
MATYVQFPDGETYVNEAALWRDAIQSGRAIELKAKEGKAARQAWLRKKLLEFIKPKTTLKVVCTHRSSSGMSARFVVLCPMATDSGLVIQDITSRVAELCGFRLHNESEIQMGGCGFSKSFQIVYELGRCLWPHGTPEPHGTRNGQPDSDGGYALGHN